MCSLVSSQAMCETLTDLDVGGIDILAGSPKHAGVMRLKLTHSNELLALEHHIVMAKIFGVFLYTVLVDEISKSSSAVNIQTSLRPHFDWRKLMLLCTGKDRYTATKSGVVIHREPSILRPQVKRDNGIREMT